MPGTPSVREDVRAQVAALRAGRGVADLGGWRKVEVSGSDAAQWLNDLLTTDLSGLRPGETRRSLLLSPTGRIRADLTVVRWDHGFLLIQHPGQPIAADALLMPYVLSSDVRLVDRSAELGLLALPSRELHAGDAGDLPLPGDREVPDGWRRVAPSALGPGTDLVGPAVTSPQALEVALRGPRVLVGDATIESWRVIRGDPRFPVDLTPESLPHETDLGAAIAFDKGCYLGQEAVARVRNLGHPPFVVLAVRATAPVAPGDQVLAEGEEAGTVTSATELADAGTAAIVRVRWGARKRVLRTAPGAELVPFDGSDP